MFAGGDATQGVLRVPVWMIIVLLLGACSAVRNVDPSPAPSVHSEAGRYRVIRVVDGDTVIIGYHGKARVRVIGIDTPEVDNPHVAAECGGKRASRAASRLLDGATVEISFNPRGQRRDQYDRLLAYITLPDGNDFGETMLRRGHADVFYAQEHPRKDRYLSAKAVAKEARRGLWGYC